MNKISYSTMIYDIITNYKYLIITLEVMNLNDLGMSFATSGVISSFKTMCVMSQAWSCTCCPKKMISKVIKLSVYETVRF